MLYNYFSNFTYVIFKNRVYKLYYLKISHTKLVIDLCVRVSLQKLVCRKCFPNNVDFENWVYILPKCAKITLGKLKLCPFSYKFHECIFLVFEKELGDGGEFQVP